MTYLLFPVNVLLGVLLGVWRMAITALFNIVHLGRTDISLLNRSVEAFDPGEPRPQVGPALCSHTHTHTHTDGRRHAPTVADRQDHCTVKASV